ncbi:MAG TPA: hypothetical protein ENN25_03800 [Euryarchaeota archaeon]|nr:hypothetical protein [Euryarchaeota archaeon]
MVTVSKINGMKVITSDAYTLGEIDGVRMDPNAWKITHLQIDLMEDAIRDLAYKKPLLGSVRICVPVDIVNMFGDVITLKTSLQQLRDSPVCSNKKSDK